MQVYSVTGKRKLGIEGLAVIPFHTWERLLTRYMRRAKNYEKMRTSAYSCMQFHPNPFKVKSAPECGLQYKFPDLRSPSDLMYGESIQVHTVKMHTSSCRFIQSAASVNRAWKA